MDNILPYAEKVVGLNGIISFDLEDIVFNNKNIILNSILKNNNRKEVIRQITRIISAIHPSDLAIRLNALETSELNYDIQLISEINFDNTLPHYFLPKIKNDDNILSYLQLFEEYKIKKYVLIPIIETSECYINIDKLISNQNYSMTLIAFGHCDFNSDVNNFPFSHQTDKMYWDWIKHIKINLISSEIIFLNSPYLFLNDSENFIEMLNHLKEIFNEKFGQVTLSLNQLINCQKFTESVYVPVNFKPLNLPANKTDYANWIISSFEKNKIINRSFAMTEEKILISPQEYLAAIEYLENKIVL
jgi:hypothetical protein